MSEERKLIIDAENLPLGRLAAYVAKRAILGYEITVANCEKAVISGSKKSVLSTYQKRIERGSTDSGPFFPKTPDRIVQRAIRGMLPYKKGKGKEAFQRVSFKKGPVQGMKTADVKKGQLYKYVSVGEISKLL